MSLWGSTMPNPGIAPPPGFREVAAYLIRDPPSQAPIEAPPETRPPNVMVGPAVAHLSATQIVQDEATGVTYVETVTTLVERVALGNPCMATQSPRAHVGEHHQPQVSSDGRWLPYDRVTTAFLTKNS